MNKTDTRRSKFLSLVLRHQPGKAGLQLDEQGWTSIKALLEGVNQALDRGLAMDRSDLQRVMEQNDKRRFELDETGTRIRARQGHSVPVELGYEALEPPETLFHGTHPSALVSIEAQGLRAMKRHAVHLSADLETARRVGGRRGRPVILIVEARRMHEDGHRFTVTDNGVWLTEAVPPEFLRFS